MDSKGFVEKSEFKEQYGKGYIKALDKLKQEGIIFEPRKDLFKVLLIE